MQRPVTMLALAAMLVQGTASWANDPTRHHTSRDGHVVRGAGLGVQIGVTIKLGPQRAVKQSERVQLNVAAGSARTVVSSTTMAAQTAIVPMVRFTLKPGYGSDLALANYTIARHKTALAAAEDQAGDADKDDKEDGDGPSTLGWVAIGVGGFVVAMGIAAVACQESNCLNSY